MAEGSAGASAGVVVVVEHEGAVDDDVLDADVVLKGFGVGRFVENSVGGEECDVGECTGLFWKPFLQNASLVRHVTKARRPFGLLQLVDRLASGIPLLLVKLSFSQLEQAGWFETAQLRDSLPVRNCFGPAVLVLAEFGHCGVGLGLIGSRFDDRCRGAFGLVVFQAFGELLIQREIVALQVDQFQKLLRRSGSVLRCVVAGDECLMNFAIVRLQVERELKLHDRHVEGVLRLECLADCFAEDRAVLAGLRGFGVEVLDIAGEVIRRDQHLVEFVECVASLIVNRSPANDRAGHGIDRLFRVAKSRV